MLHPFSMFSMIQCRLEVRPFITDIKVTRIYHYMWMSGNCRFTIPGNIATNTRRWTNVGLMVDPSQTVDQHLPSSLVHCLEFAVIVDHQIMLGQIIYLFGLKIFPKSTRNTRVVRYIYAAKCGCEVACLASDRVYIGLCFNTKSYQFLNVSFL